MLSLYNTIYLYEEKLLCQNCSVSCNNTGNEKINISADNFDSGFIPDMDDIIRAWPQVAQLTNRELEVFKEIILNKKRRDIAEELCVSENTVKKHISNIFMKLEVSSRADIMNVLLQIK
jgi:LuxR family transcriptional regulator of spore coat protein